jgi:hypothetical protein
MFDHEEDGDRCVCGPEIKPVEREDGDLGFVIVHNSFDGREKYE